MKKAIIGVGTVLLFVAAGLIIVLRWRPIQKQVELTPTQVDNGIEFDSEQNQALGKPIYIQDLKNGDIVTVDLSQINQEVHKRVGSYFLPEHPFFVENPSIEMGMTIKEDGSLLLDIQRDGLLFLLVNERRMSMDEARIELEQALLSGKKAFIENGLEGVLWNRSLGRRTLSFSKNGILVQLTTAAENFTAQNPASYVSDDELVEFAKILHLNES